MFYKLSNTANRETVENEIGVQFKHPQIYQPESIINGFDESSISVITSENPYTIDYGIWGILPKTFKDDWESFQHVSNTLNIKKSDLQSNDWYLESYNNKRCLIIVTGFFTSYIKDGEVFPYYVYTNLQKPITLAGIYNTLECDGFVTCSPILTKANEFVKRIHNTNQKMPLIIEESLRSTWLNTSLEIDLDDFVNQSNKLDLKAHPIAKEFFKNGIMYDSILEPVQYGSLPVFNKI